MVEVVRRESREKRGFFGQVFLIVFFLFNGFMIYWLFDYWGSVGKNMSPTMSEAEKAGAGLGLVFGTGLILFIWALGAVITGLLAILTRGKRTYVEIPQITAATSVGKKCPMCAESVQQEAKICRFCGYNFDLQTRVAAISPRLPGEGL